MDVAHDLVVTEDNCGTSHGLVIAPLIEGGDVVEPLRERVLGRVTAEDLTAPGTKKVEIPAGTLLDETWVDALEGLGIDEVRVRSASGARQDSGSRGGQRSERSAPDLLSEKPPHLLEVRGPGERGKRLEKDRPV